MSLQIIGGQWKGRRLKTPPSSITRPTGGMLREAVFNICQHEIEGAAFLDICAGSGAMGFEALSRGAAHVTLIEKNRQALKAIHENQELLGAKSQVTIISASLDKGLAQLKDPFDIIYLDPPYDIPTAPIIAKLLHLLKPTSLLLIEERFSKTSPPPIHPHLTHIKTKKFGDTLLHQYRL